MATQKESKSENLKKIQVLEPPQIDVRTEGKLVGTYGICEMNFSIFSKEVIWLASGLNVCFTVG